MVWIKRNLIFVVGCLAALGLIVAGGFYIGQGLMRNAAASSKLTENYETLKTLQMRKPAPGNEKINNTIIAREQQRQVQAWIAASEKYFQFVPAIPSGEVTSEAFASALRRTVDQLQRSAADAGVVLPPKYDFSFSAQRPLVKFAAGSLEPLAVQLGEVKAISAILFSTRINALDGIQRIRVSDDDATGPQGDYTDVTAVTNDLAVITPYVITFRCFTPEFSRVLSAFGNSSNAFLIKAINVQPASGIVAGAGAMYGEAVPGGMESMEGNVGRMRGRVGYESALPLGTPSGLPPQPATKGGLQTVIKEQLLRVTMEVGLVKLLPKK